MEKYRNIEVHHLSEKEFDHGRTRAKGVQYSKADAFVCMTQDALPVDNQLIQNLICALTKQDNIAAAYARQLPHPDCREIEKYTRSFNYPEDSFIKSFQAFFCIHNNNFPHGICLLLQCLNQSKDWLCGLVGQQYDIYTVLHGYPPSESIFITRASAEKTKTIRNRRYGPLLTPLFSIITDTRFRCNTLTALLYSF